LSLILPTAEAGSAYTAGGDLILPSLYWMQQLEGGISQAGSNEVYTTSPADYDGLWKWESYGGVMMDMHQMMVQAKQTNSPWYDGIAKTLMAYKLMTITDLFGDVPYTYAFKGDANLHPTYDSQQSIYTTILPNLLDSAIIELLLPKTSNTFIPGSDDLIYAGDPSQWVKLAYSLKARMYIHQSKVSTTAYSDALSALAKAFTGNSDDFQFAFGSDETAANPIYQMNEQRTGYIAGLGDKLVNIMNGGTPKNFADDDPRLAIYAAQTSDTAYRGYSAGIDTGEASQIGTYFSSNTSPVNMLSFAEVKFIEAEARFQTNDLAGAAAAYDTAVKASLNKLGVLGVNSTWETANLNESAATISLSKIMNAKFVALYLNMEVFSDWRRHDDLIAITPATGNVTNNVVPRRYLYPNDELITNGANVPKGVHITDHVWWDK
jgi:hypothetical protein